MKINNNPKTKRINHKNVLSFILEHADVNNIKILYNHFLKEEGQYQSTWDNLSFEDLKVKNKTDKSLMKRQETRRQTMELLHKFILRAELQMEEPSWEREDKKE